VVVPTFNVQQTFDLDFFYNSYH